MRVFRRPCLGIRAEGAGLKSAVHDFLPWVWGFEIGFRKTD